MKTILILIFNLFLSQSFAEVVHIHDRPSVHGMLIVGKSKIYLSHLPMFHTPHDYQILIEAEFSQQAKSTYLNSLDTTDETVYTLVPEVFVLPDMIKNPKPFTAKIYKGHFERDGVMLAEKVTVEIKKILFFKKFDLKKVKPENGSYLLFGDEKEQFLAHDITSKPDFDQILKVVSEKEIISELKNKSFIPLTIKSVKNTNPLVAPSTLDAEANGTNFSIQIKSNIYLELGDLAF